MLATVASLMTLTACTTTQQAPKKIIGITKNHQVIDLNQKQYTPNPNYITDPEVLSLRANPPTTEVFQAFGVDAIATPYDRSYTWQEVQEYLHGDQKHLYWQKPTSTLIGGERRYIYLLLCHTHHTFVCFTTEKPVMGTEVLNDPNRNNGLLDRYPYYQVAFWAEQPKDVDSEFAKRKAHALNNPLHGEHRKPTPVTSTDIQANTNTAQTAYGSTLPNVVKGENLTITTIATDIATVTNTSNLNTNPINPTQELIATKSFVATQSTPSMPAVATNPMVVVPVFTENLENGMVVTHYSDGSMAIASSDIEIAPEPTPRLQAYTVAKGDPLSVVEFNDEHLNGVQTTRKLISLDPTVERAILDKISAQENTLNNILSPASPTPVASPTLKKNKSDN